MNVAVIVGVGVGVGVLEGVSVGVGVGVLVGVGVGVGERVGVSVGDGVIVVVVGVGLAKRASDACNKGRNSTQLRAAIINKAPALATLRSRRISWALRAFASRCSTSL